MTVDNKPESGIDFNAYWVAYRARATELLGNPRARREDVPADFLGEYDRLHQDIPGKDPEEILDAIDDLESIDGPNPGLTLPNPLTGIMFRP